MFGVVPLTKVKKGNELQFIAGLCLLPFEVLREVWLGVATRTFPLQGVLFVGCLLVWALFFGADEQLLLNHGLTKYFGKDGILREAYSFAVAFCPVGIWGLYRVALKRQLAAKVERAFKSSGLKNSLGMVPKLIADVPIGDGTRKLVLQRMGLSLSKFDSTKESLESALCIYINDLTENRTNGRVSIIYSKRALPRKVMFEESHKIGAHKFPVGQSRSGLITADLREVPHVLVAGETSGGKSTFLRQLIFTLYRNNQSYEFTLVDLKGGLEFQLFESQSRIDVVPDISSAVNGLARLNKELDDRFRLLKAAKLKDLDSVNRLKPGPETRQLMSLGRKVLVIDEASELFLIGPAANATQAQKARRIVSRLTRLGRAAGIHVVIGTQRPDAKALDTQIKANLGGKICFQISDLASSLVVLGNGRAKDLPRIPGRAIWQRGLDMTEVQTPLLEPSLVESWFDEHTSGTQSAERQ